MVEVKVKVKAKMAKMDNEGSRAGKGDSPKD